MYFIFFALLYFYSSMRGNLFSYIFTWSVVFLIAIYDIARITSDNYISVLIGLASVCIFTVFMTLTPLYSNLNKEKEVPDRVTGWL
jgi:hypothetical protein